MSWFGALLRRMLNRCADCSGPMKCKYSWGYGWVWECKRCGRAEWRADS